MPEDYPPEPVPYEEHERIVARLQQQKDDWVERYTDLDEYMRETRRVAIALVSQARIIRLHWRAQMVVLEERVTELEEKLRARFPD